MNFKLFVKILGFAFLMTQASEAQNNSTILSDFEVSGAWSTLGTGWYGFSDKSNEGESAITTADSMFFWDSTSFVPGALNSLGALKVGFKFGTKLPTCGVGCSYPAQVGIGTNMHGELDITGATGISFWARADAPLKITIGVGTTEVTDNGNFSSLFSLTPTWTKYTIKLKDLTQPSWAIPLTFDPAHLKSIGFGISKGDNGTMTQGALYIDNVVIEGWVEPVAAIIPKKASHINPVGRAQRYDLNGKLKKIRSNGKTR